MSAPVQVVVYLLALVFFLLAAWVNPVGHPFNLVALGLALVTLVWLVAAIQAL